MSRNERFRKTVDAVAGVSDSSTRYEDLLAHLDSAAQSRQYEIEQEAAEIVQLLQRSAAHGSQIGDVRQMAWLHLKLLAARASLSEVIEVADREHKKLDEQEQRCRERLGRARHRRRTAPQSRAADRSHRLRGARRIRSAEKRQELVDAELGRLRQQVSLVREQVLLATDENSMAHSLDAVSASLNEANRWLKDQRELFAGHRQFHRRAAPGGSVGFEARASNAPRRFPSDRFWVLFKE